MTEREFREALSSRFELGDLLGLADPSAGDDDVLRAARGRPAARAPVEMPAAPASPKTRATKADSVLFECSQLTIRAAGSGQARLESVKIPPGWMLFVGCARTDELRSNWSFTVPTPFHRALCAALAHQNDKPRSLALVALAARLSWHGVKESILREAARSARASGASDLIRLVISHYPDGHASEGSPDPAAEPCCESGPFRGRFVVLRPYEGEASEACVSAAAVSQGEGWETVWKLVHFTSEVEAAPTLLLRSLQEALESDPASSAAWLKWAERRLGANPRLRQQVLGLLAARPGT